jgi:hypothetical protein
LAVADWSAVAEKAEITVFSDHIDQLNATRHDGVAMGEPSWQPSHVKFPPGKMRF